MDKMMRRYLVFVFISAMSLIAGNAQSQERKLGLMDVYSMAMERDAAHAAKRASRDAGVEKGEQGAAAMLPRVILEGGLSYTDQDNQYKGTDILRSGRRDYAGGGYSLTVAQPLFNMKNMAMRRQGQAATEMAQTAFHMAGQELIERSARAYFNVLLAQTAIDLINAQKEAISKHLARARKSFEVGAASITDTHEAQARYDLTVSQEIMARQGLQIAREELTKIIGEESFTLAPLSGQFSPAPPMPNDIDQWAEEAQKNSPYLALMQKALEVATEETAKAQGDRFPTADLVGNYNYSNQGGSSFGIGMESTTQSVNLRISVPLYTGGAMSSRVREARANEEKARFELEEARRQTRQLVRSAFMQVVSAQAEVNALKQAMVSSQSALASTRQGFEVGLRNAVDVLDAERQGFDARHALARAKYNYLLSLLRLDAAAGRLDEDGLRKVAGYLAP